MVTPFSSSGLPVEKRLVQGAELRLVPAGGALRAEVGQGEGFVQQQDGLPGRGELQHHGGVRVPGATRRLLLIRCLPVPLSRRVLLGVPSCRLRSLVPR